MHKPVDSRASLPPPPRVPRLLFHARQIRAMKWFNVATMAISACIALAADPSGVRYATAYDEQYAATRAAFASLVVYLLQIASTALQCDIFYALRAAYPGIGRALPCRRYLAATGVLLVAWAATIAGVVAVDADGSAHMLRVAVATNAFAIAQLLLAASQATYWARDPVILVAD